MSKKVLALLVAVLLVVPMFAFAAGEPEKVAPMEETLTLKVVHSYDLSSAGDIAEGMTPENGGWNNDILEYLNIKFDWMWTVTSDQWNQRFQLSVSAGDIPDLLRLTDVQFRTFLDANSLREVTEEYNTFTLQEMFAMDDALNNRPTRQATVDGKLMAVPRFEDTHSSMYLYFYRTDWAEKLNIAQPETIYDVMAMAEAFATQDPDGNGEDDTYGIGISDDPFGGAFGALAFYQSFGGYPMFWIEKDGAVMPGVIQDETLEGLKALREMYAKGNNTIPRDFMSINADQLNERVIQSKVGIVYGMWWNPAYPLNLNVDYDNNATWAVLPITSTTAGEVGKSIVNQNAVQFYNAVYTGAPEKTGEALVKILNYDYIYLAPVDNDTWPADKWPRYPVPQSEEEREAQLAFGKQKLLDGQVWNWLPVQTWPSNGNVLQAQAANMAWKTGDMSYIRNSGDMSWYQQTADYYNLGKDAENPTYGSNWGMVHSRTDDNGGILTTVRLRDEGNVTENVYYGAATETEQQVSATLRTFAQEYFTKYIMGEVSEDSWQSEFVDQWLIMGGQDWWDEVAEAYAALN